MNVLLTGATGYIGQRLLNELISEGHHVVCCVRDKNRFNPPSLITNNIEVIELDFLEKETLTSIPQNIDAAYYLMHSMSTANNYKDLELLSASNFREVINKTLVKHVIYLSGIVNEKSLSIHLASRKAVEDELGRGNYHLTTLRAGIIIGAGSASFEIIRDLVEQLPLMITPKWIETKCQPIGIKDVITFLVKSLMNEAVFDNNYDIGGPDILTYKEMLLGYAKVRGLKRIIFTLPIMTPRLSSYWLFFLASTSYKLASALVSSMKVEVICRNTELNQILDIEPVGYEGALRRTLTKIEDRHIISSWKDSLVSGNFNVNISEFLDVPTHGCLKDERTKKVINRDRSIERLWRIGGKTGWYYATWLWQIRGFIDKLFGGVGLRRGRTHENKLDVGDAVDFWRVLYANKTEGRLLLFAEMKLPGEAWLEFKIIDDILYQTATIRPKGLWGRLYWYSVYPFHMFVFQGLINRLSK